MLACILVLIFLRAVFTLPTETAAAYNCTHPPDFTNFDVNSCCRIPEINLGTVPENCTNQINQLKLTDEKYPAYAHVCYPDCIYRETGALVDGEVQIEIVKRFLERNVHRRDKDIVPHIVRSFESCVNNIKGHMQAAGLQSYKKLPQGCTPFASMVYSCVNAETFLNCPTKMWKNEQHCNLAKGFAEQCNPLPHVPLPMN